MRYTAPKDERLVVRISHEDKRRVIELAQQRGMSLSDLFRQSVIENQRVAA